MYSDVGDNPTFEVCKSEPLGPEDKEFFISEIGGVTDRLNNRKSPGNDRFDGLVIKRVFRLDKNLFV